MRLLVSGDVVVAGTISVAGERAADTGAAGDGNTADDGDAGAGGPGGYDGGRGGRVRTSLGDNYDRFSEEDALAVSGEWGHGPGGGAGARFKTRMGDQTYGVCPATSANFSILEGIEFARRSLRERCSINGISSIGAYGNATLLPLVGGSGGGGGWANSGINGAGGGGGGGALLIAASGAVNITGTITADGGGGGWFGRRFHSNSGSGSGGAIRIIATTVSGNGRVYARGGGTNITNGRIRIEAERMTFTGRSEPQYLLGRPGSLYFDGRPSVRIVSVGEQSVPAQPSGSTDVTFADTLTSAVNISLEASNVPLGTVVSVNVIPVAGDLVRANSTPLAGSVSSSTATASVTLPAGPSTLQAFTMFEVQPADTATQSMYTPYTGGELVAQVSLGSGTDAEMTLVTASGRTIVVPASVVQ